MNRKILLPPKEYTRFASTRDVTTLKYVSVAGGRELGVNYSAGLNSWELELTMLQHSFHVEEASACNPSVFINPVVSTAASTAGTSLFVELAAGCQGTFSSDLCTLLGLFPCTRATAPLSSLKKLTGTFARVKTLDG